MYCVLTRSQVSSGERAQSDSGVPAHVSSSSSVMAQGLALWPREAI